MHYNIRLKHHDLATRELLVDLTRVAKLKRKKFLSIEDYRKHGKFSIRPYINKFGSWIIALHSAGLDSPYLKTPTDVELFDNLKSVWRKIGKQPGYRHMKPPFSRYWAKAYIKPFGTWNRALEMFRLYMRNKKKYRKELMKLTQRKKPKRDIPISLRYEILKRDKFKCKACGRSPANQSGVLLTIDHIKPLSRGGKTINSNLQTLCMDCNIGKGSRRK